MKTGFNLAFKFLVPVLALFLVIAAVLSFQTSALIKKVAISQASSFVVDFVQLQAKQHIDSASVFSLADAQRTNQIFSKVKQEVKTKDVVRIKVWDKDAIIIFSDDQSIIGQKFADNKEFQKAIEGEAEVEIKEPLKPENTAEKGYRQLMEVYVPVVLAGESKPAGVIETYYNMDVLNLSIKKAQTLVITINIVAFFVMAIVLSVLFKFLVLNPIEKLEVGILELKGTEK